MDKQIVNMKKWQIYRYEDNHYNLSGTADKHPKLGKNVYVAYTSHLVNALIENDILRYETKNTIYMCPLKYIDINCMKNIDDERLIEFCNSTSDFCLDILLKLLANIAMNKNLDDFSKHLIEIAKIGNTEILEENKKTEKRLMEIVKEYPDSIYLEINNIEDSSDILAYNIENKIGLCRPMVHVGMFQDSVLYTEPGILDFRYFPGYQSVKTYSWSDNIKQVVVKNCMDEPLSYNNKKINVNDIKIFTSDEHCQGLISPDCVTGKSILK